MWELLFPLVRYESCPPPEWRHFFASILCLNTVEVCYNVSASALCSANTGSLKSSYNQISVATMEDMPFTTYSQLHTELARRSPPILQSEDKSKTNERQNCLDPPHCHILNLLTHFISPISHFLKKFDWPKTNINSTETPTEHASIFDGSLKLEGMTTVSDYNNNS